MQQLFLFLFFQVTELIGIKLQSIGERNTGMFLPPIPNPEVLLLKVGSLLSWLFCKLHGPLEAFQPVLSGELEGAAMQNLKSKSRSIRKQFISFPCLNDCGSKVKVI